MELSVVFTDDLIIGRDGESHQIKPVSLSNSDTIRNIKVSMIAVVGPEGAIGYQGDLLWHLPEDLRHFKELTLGASVIMGRKTWESLPKKPLPGRLNIVVTRNPRYEASGAVVTDSLQKAVEMAKGNEIFIIGGGEIYKEGMQYSSRLYITEVFERPELADTYFPEIDPRVWAVADVSETFTSTKGIRYRFITYNRKL